MLEKHLIPKTNPVANAKQVYCEDGLRITVLTPRLIRVETGSTFCDQATQVVWFRDLEPVDYGVEKSRLGVKITTSSAVFFYSFLKESVTYVLLGDKKIKLKNIKKQNLGGTTRSLDNTVKSVRIGEGIASLTGVAVLTDKSLMLCGDGMLEQRATGTTDTYIFAHGLDYVGALADYYKITGPIPLIPRAALGNWWSRWKAYSQDEYINLMKRFKSEYIPFSMATIDMDWHIVNVKKYFPDYVSEKMGFIERTFWGDGWTGYTWDPELFPDYKGFLNWLKTNGLSTILNLHPARGVRWFESQYSDMAKAVGIDPSTKESVKLSLSNPKFVNAYFKYLHRPYENAGVDHWWVDWQQGRKSEQKHLDPLWALNHFHSLEANTNNRRPLILSRYAGPGSHRYPIGFSGDAMSSWRCLRFQPYFTATAANIGYTWWSHDIGGFWGGIKNDELYLRWLQFGVYSPINRLHSTRNELMGKEVWNYRPDVQHYARRLLIKRHKLIPYTYTMNWRTHKEGLPICQPLYHKYPEYAESYQYKNQYFFGSELLACPITKKSSGKMALSTVKVWLPKGRWTDINTDRVYQGNRELVLTREIHEIPVFAKEGAIIPFAAEEEMFNTGLPKALNIHIYRGNNKFSLYEDSGNDATHIDGNYALTDISIADDGSNNAVVKIEAAKGDGAALLPKKRKIGITLKDISTAKNVSILLNGKTVKPLIESNPLRVTLLDIKPTDSIEMTISSYKERGNLQFGDEVVRLFSRLGISNIRKSIKYSRIKNLINDKKRFAKTVKKMRLPKVLKGALSELILMEN